MQIKNINAYMQYKPMFQTFKIQSMNMTMPQDTISFGASCRKDPHIDYDCITNPKIKKAIQKLINTEENISREQYIKILKYFGYTNTSKEGGMDIYRRVPYASGAMIFKIPNSHIITGEYKSRLQNALARINDTKGELCSSKSALCDGQIEEFLDMVSDFQPDTDTNEYRKNLIKKQKSSEIQTQKQEIDDKYEERKQAGIEYTRSKQQELIDNAEKEKELEYIADILQKSKSLLEEYINNFNQYINENTTKIDLVLESASEFKVYLNSDFSDQTISMINKYTKKLKHLKIGAETLHKREKKLKPKDLSKEQADSYYKEVEQFCITASDTIHEYDNLIDEKFRELGDLISKENEHFIQYKEERAKRHIKRCYDWERMKNTGITDFSSLRNYKTETQETVEPPKESEKEGSDIIPDDDNIEIKDTKETPNIVFDGDGTIKTLDSLTEADRLTDTEAIELNDKENLKLQDETMQIFEKTAKKIMPFAIPEAQKAVTGILTDLCTAQDIEIINSTDIEEFKNLMNNKINEITLNSQYKQILRAAIYAVLSVQNQPNAYSMPLNKIIEAGKNYNKADTDKVQKMFDKYNKPLSQDDFEKVKNELLLYCDNISDEEKEEAESLIQEEGGYLAVLIDEEQNDEAKASVLKQFWSDYDEKFATSYTDSVISKFNEIKVHKDKLKEIGEADSSDFALDIY